jgi:hypothetical protein
LAGAIRESCAATATPSRPEPLNNEPTPIVVAAAVVPKNSRLDTCMAASSIQRYCDEQ